MSKKCYDLGFVKASLEKVSNRYDLTVYVKKSSYYCKHSSENYDRYLYRCKTKEEALEEILSYAEMDEEDFDLAVAGGSGLAFDFR